MDKKFPINRLSKFYDQSEFELENEMAREFVEGDLNIVVVLFQVDKLKSITDDIYGESKTNEIKFKPPIELKIYPILDKTENKTYSDGYLRFQDYGKLTFTIFIDHLKELGVDISYGDYIGYPDFEHNIKYFTVVDDGRIFSDNQHTRMGYKGYYRTIVCTPTDINEFSPNI